MDETSKIETMTLRFALVSATALTVVLSLTSSAPAAGSAQDKAAASDVLSCIIRPRQVVQLASSVAGRIAEEFVDRGDPVSLGQVVAKLDSSVEEAQLALDRYKAANSTQIEAGQVDLEWNQRELERKKRLINNLYAKINDVDEYATKVAQDRLSIRKAEIDQHIAGLEAERSSSQLMLKQVKSSVNGVVTERKLSPGEYVYEQTPIMTIAQIDPLSVELVVSAARYGTVKVGAIVEIHPKQPVGGAYRVKVDVVDPVIDAASETFGVRLALPNPGNTIPAGIRCSAQLPDTTMPP